MKPCRDCGDVEPLGDFPPQAPRPDGRDFRDDPAVLANAVTCLRAAQDDTSSRRLAALLPTPAGDGPPPWRLLHVPVEAGTAAP